ncbi:MAG TPA: hypothetical protein VF767_00485 [Bryobacteraceae bacterium]
MTRGSRIDPARLIGRSPEQLEIRELAALAGRFVALEIYTPQTVPLRKIEAIGDTAEECMTQLAARGLDPHRFEYTMLKLRF